MSRRSVRVLGACAVLAVAAACGGDGGGGGGEGARGRDVDVDPSLCPVDALEGTDGPVQIEFWHTMTDANEATLDELTNAYNESQDQVRVDLVYKGTYDETLDAYLAGLQSGDLPDMVQLEETVLQLMIDSGSTVPAEACVQAADLDTSDLLPRVLDQFRVEDVLWPMPFNISNPVYYYNRLDFEEAGLDPDDPPATLEELEETARAIVDSGAASHGFSLEIQPWYPEQWQSMAGEEIVNNGNGRDQRATETNLDTEVMNDIYELVSRMVDEGTALNVGRNPEGRAHFLAIAGGDAASTIGTSAALGTIYDLLGQGQFAGVELGVGPVPGPGGDGATTAGGAALWMVADGTEDPQRAAVWDYMQFLTSPESQVTWHIGTGYIPIRQSAADDPAVAQLWEERPGFRIAFDQLADPAEPPGGGGPVMGAYVEFRDAFENALERMFTEGQDPAEALQQTIDDADAAIQDYNERVDE